MYAFILGKTPELSIAELSTVFKNASSFRVTKNRYAAFVDAKVEDAQKLLNRLGGSTEILQVFAENISIAKIDEKILEYLRGEWSEASGKHNFGINLVPENKGSQLLKHLLPKVKKTLKSEGISVNFMNNNFQNVSPVFAAKHGFIRDGGNISIIEEGEGLVSLGATIAVQDFEMYSKRDYSKPFRDSHVGMIPPKLAQMMINLAGLEAGAESLIVDPFCGSGTIIMEALLSGYSTFGSDLDARMTKGADQNVEWIRRECKIPIEYKSNVVCSPAEELKEITKAKNIAIVTEPNLGPPVLRLPNEAEINKTIAKLGDLYIKAFKNFAKILPAGSPVVFIFPYFRLPNREKRRVSEQVIDKITALGYSISAFDPLHGTSLFYERFDQIVGREIIKLVKQ